MIVHTHLPKRKRKKGKTHAAPRRARKAFKEKSAPVETMYRAPGTEQYPSHIDEFLATHDPKNPMPVKYEGAMAEREAAAQVEKQHKSKTVAPAYNKGPLQPVTSKEQAKWIGRK